jgi:hypothetical protein
METLLKNENSFWMAIFSDNQPVNPKVSIDTKIVSFSFIKMDDLLVPFIHYHPYLSCLSMFSFYMLTQQ